MNELDLFADAIAIAELPKRAEFLDRECAGRPDLRRRLDQLLEAHARSHPLLDPPDAGNPNDTGTHPPASSQVGAVIAGRYKLLEEIGEGGMGAVWMAEQREPVKRLVALKLIKPGMDSRSVLARFEAERQALALMDHPNIAKVLDGGTTAEGRPYFVMELVKGLPLTEYCDARRATAEMWEKLNRTDAMSLYDAARWRAVTAAVQAKTPGTDAARLAKDDADLAMAWLTKAVAAGYKDAAHMKKDADLGYLRDREDFKKLLADLEAESSPRKDPAPPRDKK